MGIKHSIVKTLIVLVFFICGKAWSQDPNFSMYHFTPVYTNPGQTGVLSDITVSLNYRNQNIEAGESFRTSALSFHYPMALGNHRLVVSGNFLNDKASDFLVTNAGFVGVAYSVKISDLSELSLGVQGGYFQRRIQDDFITDDQFVNGAFDPTIVSGDGVLNQSRNYPSVSSGIYYVLKNEAGDERAFIGMSLYNFIEPDVSLMEDGKDKLPLTYKAVAGYRIYEAYKFSVLPTIRWVHQAQNDYLNLGPRFEYDISNNKKNGKKVELGVWYNTNDLGVLSLAYEQPKLMIGLSYDFPLNSEQSNVQNGIFELALAIKLKGNNN